MSAQWQNREYGSLIDHLTKLRNSRKYLGTRRGPGRCGSCRGARRVVLVGAEYKVLYSEPCLACEGDGTTDRATTPA
ncbi:hypothetical protein ACFXGT_11720 [Streptomyces sp. NPDC059352]|uniref:hypothetical protein n=1 Tax=Streptomyces sp. NPDC059352 TaxID=3346810 RepID=UPI0036C3B545